MRTTQSSVRSWVLEGRSKGATHLVVACDSLSYEDYPIYVRVGESVRKVLHEHQRPERMTRIVAVFDFRLPIEFQLGLETAWFPAESEQELLSMIAKRLDQQAMEIGAAREKKDGRIGKMKERAKALESMRAYLENGGKRVANRNKGSGARRGNAKPVPRARGASGKGRGAAGKRRKKEGA